VADGAVVRIDPPGWVVTACPLVASVALAGAALVCARGRSRALEDGAGDRGPVLRAPHIAQGIVLDGDTDDGAWTGSPQPARTGLFADPLGGAATPASEARLLWGDGVLYVLLYAADEDIRSEGDFFRLTFARDRGGARPFVFDVSPRGSPPDGIHVAREIDGTVDDAGDRDEEWVVELAIDLAALGLEAVRGRRFGFAIRRCDAGGSDGGSPACASWGDGEQRGHVVLE
jgi:hypothetical protein